MEVEFERRLEQVTDIVYWLLRKIEELEYTLVNACCQYRDCMPSAKITVPAEFLQSLKEL